MTNQMPTETLVVLAGVMEVAGISSAETENIPTLPDTQDKMMLGDDDKNQKNIKNPVENEDHKEDEVNMKVVMNTKTHIIHNDNENKDKVQPDAIKQVVMKDMAMNPNTQMHDNDEDNQDKKEAEVTKNVGGATSHASMVSIALAACGPQDDMHTNEENNEDNEDQKQKEDGEVSDDDVKKGNGNAEVMLEKEIEEKDKPHVIEEVVKKAKEEGEAKQEGKDMDDEVKKDKGNAKVMIEKEVEDKGNQDVMKQQVKKRKEEGEGMDDNDKEDNYETQFMGSSNDTTRSPRRKMLKRSNTMKK